ncbi:MAG: proline dehydrogenase family protein [Ignavibacteriales bacterium]|nr:proline dehydrogenase family protein [Ignavibacteriales bacterium]
MQILNQFIVHAVQLMPKQIVRIFANKYIAGDKLEDGVAMVKKLNAKGILATMDVLGEAISTREEALESLSKCHLVLETIQKEKLNSNLSIKPTQAGLELDPEFCYREVKKLMDKAKSFNNFVRLDMEDSSTTDSIIDLFRKLRAEYTNVGIVIQAYMRRSMDDITALNKIDAGYRICKGIYVEPENIAFKGKQEVRDNFLALLQKMLKDGKYVGIATHDMYLIDKAKNIIKELGIPQSQFEFQMLLGVREDIRDMLNKEGFKVRIYVPFGKDWYKYSIRRLKENPKIAGDIFKNIFSIN